MKCRHDFKTPWKGHYGPNVYLMLTYIILKTGVIYDPWESIIINFSPSRVGDAIEPVFAVPILNVFCFREVEVIVSHDKVYTVRNPYFQTEVGVKAVAIEILFTINAILLHKG
jgi:hypothetical protein